ncbi:hypothetical protein CXF59_10505 [Flavobacterium sp. ALD4]|uniref:hypothetical protein n=1 Tax=Flavobacterium sp. ALD4 TaxID=2058314 RepID=UPI000C31DAD2|nr:hypothetical protein [Flavobacterium sp. ALD4]PKH66382.1 hypothetical protein CXF59_10505 [Flavobacterium sp. ALD4]
MIKKLLLLALVAAQLTTSCSSDNSEIDEVTSENLNEQIANLVKQPYSKLTPGEQKIKLEAEANEMLLEMDKSKTSGAVEAIQNLGNLLDISSVDIFNGKNDNQIEDILNVSGVYGIYTWNSTKKIWIKTTSTTELKFVFPAKTTTTNNNATFSSKATSSDIKVKLEDTYGNWVYNPKTDMYTQTPSINDEFFLPTSVDANLTIDNAPAATFAIKAKYSNGKETPDDFSYKMILNDGYAYGISSKKGDVNSVESTFTYKEKNIVKFTVGSSAKIDALIDDNDALVSYRGTANGLVELMDNFVIVADIDIAGLGNDEAALEKSLAYPDYNTSAYYSKINQYNKAYSEAQVLSSNKNIKLILVSKKDGTKIADVITRSEKEYSYNSYAMWVTSNNNYGGYWGYNSNGGPVVQYYEEVLYMKFGDGTEVEMSAYFSTGFDDLEKKFEDFLKSFER